MVQYSYITEGVCSKVITFTIENDTVKNVSFLSGCPGNLEGISRLIEGMNVHEVIKKLQGIQCGGKPTSCPDQLSKALEEYLNNQEISVQEDCQKSKQNIIDSF